MRLVIDFGLLYSNIYIYIGGKHFSRDLRPLDPEDQPSLEYDAPEDEAKIAWRQRRKSISSSSSEAEEGSESENEGEAGAAVKQKPQIEVANPNWSSSSKVDPPRLSRREREAMEAAAAKERYWKLHAQGKTDQAKADLARLAIIRKEREAKAAERKAEQEAKATAQNAKLQAQGRRK
ncbi:casein kinase substrate phosphoprotein PP28-domain-containing protein [Dipodascopsis uninucleata]